jgi:Polyketide cyclase / dehydrase and lipid transport
MRWIFGTLIALALVAILIAVIGSRLPTKHQVSRTLRLSLPPDLLYSLLADVDRYQTWRPGVTALNRLVDRDGLPAWVETVGSNRVPLAFERMERPSLLVTRISDPTLPFGGTWTYRISPVADGSELTIVEDGEVYNPLFRFMARFVFGHTATIDTFLGDLRAKAGAGGTNAAR